MNALNWCLLVLLLFHTLLLVVWAKHLDRRETEIAISRTKLSGEWALLEMCKELKGR